MHIPAPVRVDEQERLALLRRLDILDSGQEDAFDEIVRVASLVTGTDIALVSLVDEHRQWFKARHGLEDSETDRHVSFCAWAVHDRKPLLVPDATEDPRFAENPEVTGGLGIRSYFGAPLLTESGHALGSLCVIDREPRELPPEQLEILEILARRVVDMIEARDVARKLAEALEKVRELAPMIPVCAWCKRVRDDEQYWSSIHEYLQEHVGTLTSHCICPECEVMMNAELDASDLP